MTGQSEEELERLRLELEGSGCRVRVSILHGEPYREIMRIASEEDVSMILMGSHGRGFVLGILWGTVSQRVVVYSEKPVLVVK